MAEPRIDTDRRRRLGHEPALDGVRGFAVLLVVLWHYPTDILERSFSWLKAGHLGVDLFFVLSGFLITALMLNEHHRDGSISFAGFYRRRGFRLLPALAMFLTATVIWANVTDIAHTGLFPGTDGPSAWASILGAAFFVLNWIHVFGDHSPMLGMAHLWSLSVEEQFYIVWPSVFVLMLTPRTGLNQLAGALAATILAAVGNHYVWNDHGTVAGWGLTILVAVVAAAGLEIIRRHRARAVWAVAVIASIIATTLLYRNGAYEGGFEVFGLYSGTPSRVDSLMVGAILAFAWTQGWIPRRCPTPVAVVAWIFFLWTVNQQDFGGPFFFRYGWTAVAIAGAVIIWAALGADDTVYGRILSFPPLRNIGKVAYGLYLWHALVFVAVRHWWGDGGWLWKTVLALAITTAVTAASWFLVEKPLLRYKSTPLFRRGPEATAAPAPTN